jgi:hypothetical protein
METITGADRESRLRRVLSEFVVRELEPKQEKGLTPCADSRDW